MTIESAIEEMRRHRIAKEIEDIRDAKFAKDIREIRAAIDEQQLKHWMQVEMIIRQYEFPGDIRAKLMQGED